MFSFGIEPKFTEKYGFKRERTMVYSTLQPMKKPLTREISVGGRRSLNAVPLRHNVICTVSTL